MLMIMPFSIFSTQKIISVSHCPAMSRTYSLKDVAEHSTREDPWIIIHDKVYSVKEFLPKHPGGETIVLNLAGKDATQGFDGKGHSERAHTWMKEYEIGVLGDAPKKWYQCCLYQSVAVAIGAIGVAAIIGLIVHKTHNI